MPEPRGNEAETMWLRRLFEQLPMIYKEPLMLQVIGGFSGNEIAQMLDIPRATVNTRLFRARVHLRQLLDGRNLELRDDEASGG
jgi:RNA polymerase sigma-70 factor (ECF subfamily)